MVVCAFQFRVRIFCLQSQQQFQTLLNTYCTFWLLLVLKTYSHFKVSTHVVVTYKCLPNNAQVNMEKQKHEPSRFHRRQLVSSDVPSSRVCTFKWNTITHLTCLSFDRSLPSLISDLSVNLDNSGYDLRYHLAGVCKYRLITTENLRVFLSCFF